jgi:hypothetical protein
MITSGPQIWNWIKQKSSSTESRAWIATAYIKASRFEKLIQVVPCNLESKILIVRWHLNDLLAGASDLAVYKIAKQHKWKVFINLDLHAKIYLFDEQSIIGSANLTERGMQGTPPFGNYELAVTISDKSSTTSWFRKILSTSVEINDELFEKIKGEYTAALSAFDTTSLLIPYSDNLQNLLSIQDHIKLYTHDLFWGSPLLDKTLDTPSTENHRDLSHDLSILGLEYGADKDAIASAFLASKPFQWLLLAVNEEAYFGRLSKDLHQALNDNPAPFRKDVKLLLSNLLMWTSEYACDYFIIDKPNHSQRVTRIRS